MTKKITIEHEPMSRQDIDNYIRKRNQKIGIITAVGVFIGAIAGGVISYLLATGILAVQI